MTVTDIAADDALITLGPEQRARIADLIEAERRLATRWWTYLNEMRARGELPDWVKQQCVGTHKDIDRYGAEREAVNRAVFGKKKYIRDEGEPEFIECFSGIEGATSVTRKQPEPVRQHRPGQTTLGSTNVRIQS